MPKIILFEHVNFKGDSRIMDHDIVDLSFHDFNDRTSSAIVISGSWTLYKNAEYKGLRWHLRENGGPENDGCYPSYKDWEGTNDSVSSIRRGYHD